MAREEKVTVVIACDLCGRVRDLKDSYQGDFTTLKVPKPNTEEHISVDVCSVCKEELLEAWNAYCR